MIELTTEHIDLIKQQAFENYVTEIQLFTEDKYSVFFEAQHLNKGDSYRNILYAIIAQAKKSGFISKGGVRLYLEFVWLFGIGFETDPQYMFRHTLSEENGLKAEIEKVDILFKQGLDYTKNIIDQSASDSRKRFNFWEKTKLLLKNPNLHFSHTNLKNDIEEQLYQLYPEKVESMHGTIQEFIENALQIAREELKFHAPKEHFLVTLSMFLWGHHIYKDPLFEHFISPKYTHSMSTAHIQEKILAWLESLPYH